MNEQRIKAIVENTVQTAPPIELEDCSPRFEALLFQQTYVGIWLYETAGQRRWTVEVNEAQDTGWLEDGVTRDKQIAKAQFLSFDEAMTVVMKLIIDTSRQDGFNEI